MLFTGGKSNIRVYDIESDYQLSKLLITGSVRDMALSPDNSKLLVSALIVDSDEVKFYIFDLDHVKRTLHDIDGTILAIDKHQNPDNNIIHLVY